MRAVSKIARGGLVPRGFESLPLRSTQKPHELAVSRGLRVARLGYGRSQTWRRVGGVPLRPHACNAALVVADYFATERGRAGYEKYRREFAKLIWQTASPKWNFDDATFERSAASFDNPDHVAIVIHNYRWRLGLADGAAEYAELEEQLANGPVITVPAITLEGDANGAPHPEPSAYAEKFSGPYSHRTDRGRHRTQPAPGGAGGVRRRRPRSRSGAMSIFGVHRHPTLRAEGHLPTFDGATEWLNSAPLSPADLIRVWAAWF